MRRLHLPLAVAVAFVFSGASAVFTQAGAAAQQPATGRGQAPPPRQWWVNKDKPAQFGKNKVHIKLADLKARHKGQANWTEVVVDDENYHSTYNQGAPGTKITSRMRPDTREFFVVVEGEMRFTLEGQPEPILAKRGSVVNIPKKTMYSAEVIGTAPALWVDANQANFKTLIPVSDPRPPQAPGHTMTKIGTTFGVGVYTGNNKPHFNLWDAEKDPKFAGQNVVQDDHMWAQAIWGYEKNLPAYDPERQRTLPRRYRRVVGHHEGADPPQHRDGGGLHVERRGRCVCAPVDVARDEICGPGPIVPPRDQRLSVHVAAGTTADEVTEIYRSKIYRSVVTRTPTLPRSA